MHGGHKLLVHKYIQHMLLVMMNGNRRLGSAASKSSSATASVKSRSGNSSSNNKSKQQVMVRPHSSVSKPKSSSGPLGFAKGVGGAGRKKVVSASDLKRMKAEMMRAEGVRVSMVENKPLILSRLKSLMEIGLRVGVDMLVGVNCVSRLLEQTNVGASRGGSNNSNRSGRIALLPFSRTTSSSIDQIYDNNGIVVCLAKDVDPPHLHSHIIDACRVRGVPLVILPRLTQELSDTLNIRSATCFAVLNSRNLSIRSSRASNESSKISDTDTTTTTAASSTSSSSSSDIDSSGKIDEGPISQSMNEAIRQSRIDSLFEFLLDMYVTSTSKFSS